MTWQELKDLVEQKIGAYAVNADEITVDITVDAEDDAADIHISLDERDKLLIVI